jgi:endonuclease YncB( thermonuclease family)
MIVLPTFAASANDTAPAAVRNVTPPNFTPGPTVSGPLEREPVPPPPPDPPRWHRFNLPMTSDSATFMAGDRVISVAGVTPPARTDTCPTAEGGRWPCGTMALWALRHFLLGRPVECFFGPADDAPQITAACRVGKTDVALWLLTNGWAKPADSASDAYHQAALSAECARRGLWRGQAMPANCPPAETGN